MTGAQLLRQAKYLLQQAAWTDAPAGAVFAPRSVFISTAFDASMLGEIMFPCAVVGPGPFRGDDENPSLGDYEFQVHVFVRHEGDRLGEAVLVGGNRTATTGSSASRGILEIEERVLAAIAKLGPVNGISVSADVTSAAVSEVVEGHTHVVRKEYTFSAFIANARSYAPAYNLAGSGTPTVTLTWSDPPPRFDLLNVLVRRAAGTVAASAFTSSTGTLVGNVALGTQTATNAPGAGTWTYAVFGAYDETGAGNQERYSDKAVVKTVTV